MTGLTLNLSGKQVGIELSEGAELCAALCQHILRDFLSPGPDSPARIVIRRSRPRGDNIPGWPGPHEPMMEKRLPDREVLAWLREVDLFQGVFPLSDQSLCAYCLGALHLFDPLTGTGHAFLLEQGPGCFRPLHRLLWMYFAQVLGEEGGCFLHAAAVAREGAGYLFLGDSGAGKSTVAGLLNKGVVLSDDSPILGRNGRGHLLFPSPYHQTSGPNGRPWAHLPSPVPVVGLFFLVKGEEVHMERITRKEAFSRIMRRSIHFFHYLSRKARLILFDGLYDLSSEVPAYDLHFSRHGDLWPVLRNVPGGGIK